MFLPVSIPQIPPVQVYWDHKTELCITIDARPSTVDLPTLSTLHETNFILRSAFGSRFAVGVEDPVVLFSADRPLKGFISRQPASVISSRKSSSGLVRETTDGNIAYIFKEWLPDKPPRDMVQHPYENYEDLYINVPHLSVERLPKRADFLHRVPLGTTPPSKKPHSVSIDTPCSA